MATSKRILYITPFGLYRRGTVRYRILPWAMLLAHSKEVQVRILVAGWDSPQQQGRVSLADNVEIDYLPFPRSFLRGGGLGLMAIWWRMAFYAWRESQLWAPDIVHLSKPIGVPFFFLLLSRIAPRPFDAPIILDCDDLESAWHTGVPFAFWWRLFGQSLESRAWQIADRVTVASHFLWKRIQEVRGDNRIHYLCNYPIAAPPPPIQMTSRRIIVPTRLLDIRPAVMAQWLHSIRRRVPHASILVVGPDKTHAALLSEALRSLNLEGVSVVTEQPLEGYYNLLSSARLGLYLVEDSAAARAKCPQRLLDMLARGVPVVSVAVGEPVHLLHGNGEEDAVPSLVPPDGASIASLVAAVWEHPRHLQTLQRRGRRVWNEFLRAERITTSLWDVYFPQPSFHRTTNI